MVSQKSVLIRVVDEATIRKFSDIKEFLGLKNDAEVFRFVINFFWKKIKHENTEILEDLDVEVDLE